MTEDLQALLLEMQNCSKPVVARVHGLALGGGVEIALACDYIVATPNASFGFPETGIGIYPGLGGTQRTSRRIGTGLTKWLLCTGQIISAEEALAIGLIDAIAPRDELDATVARFVASRPAAERRPGPTPVAYQELATFFDANDVETIRTGRAPTGGDQVLERAAVGGVARRRRGPRAARRGPPDGGRSGRDDLLDRGCLDGAAQHRQIAPRILGELAGP
jgi:enoyl-CoA hydratase/3-hydroxyacyl-CoA dehydrogenase